MSGIKWITGFPRPGLKSHAEGIGSIEAVIEELESVQAAIISLAEIRANVDWDGIKMDVAYNLGYAHLLGSLSLRLGDVLYYLEEHATLTRKPYVKEIIDLTDREPESERGGQA